MLDTAGINRRAKAQRASLERSSVLFAIKTIQSSDISVLVIDAQRGVTSHEKKIASFILDSKSSVILVVNKSDMLINQSKGVKEEYEDAVRKELRFLRYVPIIFVSALEGENVKSVVDLSIKVCEERLSKSFTYFATYNSLSYQGRSEFPLENFGRFFRKHSFEDQHPQRDI